MTTCYHLEKRVFFVHIPKCAGTTIGGRVDPATGEWERGWLEQVCAGWSIDRLPNGHQPVRMIEPVTGKPIDWWDRIVAIIRNPFDQQVSQYRFWRSRGWQNAQNMKGSHQDDITTANLSFANFVRHPVSLAPNTCCGVDGAEQAGGYYRWWMMDHNGEIPPNVHVCHAEALNRDLPAALAPYGETTPPIKVTNTVRENVDTARRRDWRTWYTPEAAEAVRRKFAWSLAVHYPEVRHFDGLDDLEIEEHMRFPELTARLTI